MRENPLVLHGTTILLRKLSADDLDDYFSLVNDPETRRLTGTQQAFTKENTLRWLENISLPLDHRMDMAVIERSTGRLIGEAALTGIDLLNRSANIRIGMHVGLRVTGKGYGTEAMRLMLEHGFRRLGLHRIELGVFAFNPRAIHVYEKLGFKREGVLRDSLYMDETFHDQILMSLLEHEFV